MSSNPFNKPGDVLTFVAPTGGVTVGVPVIIGSRLVIPKVTVAATVSFEGAVSGVFYLAKTTSQAWVTGQPLYWSTGNSKASNDASAGLMIGEAAEAAASAATSGYVKIGMPVSGAMCRQIRKRFTVAEVNAGATILPAIDEFKYRMIGCKAISVGGAAGAVTTVDVLGTQTTSAKLVAYAQANLTQSTVLRDGATGGTVLADGASYVACDENTAITIGKTGSSVTTATHIDIIFTYAIDAA